MGTQKSSVRNAAKSRECITEQVDAASVPKTTGKSETRRGNEISELSKAAARK
jgi:hypothetical protein